jgi:hypothetical protein
MFNTSYDKNGEIVEIPSDWLNFRLHAAEVLKSLGPGDEFEVDDDWRPGPFYFFEALKREGPGDTMTLWVKCENEGDQRTIKISGPLKNELAKLAYKGCGHELVNRGVIFEWEYAEEQNKPLLRRPTSTGSSRCTIPAKEDPEQPNLEATKRPDLSRKQTLLQPETEAGTSKRCHILTLLKNDSNKESLSLRNISQ